MTQSSKQQLIDKIRTMFEESHGGWEPIADWIIEDRKRICEPLMDWYKWDELKPTPRTGIMEAIDKCIELAGLEAKDVN